jgi:hypothetical protein
VVAIDPNSGDVIALVSTPGFDPNPFGRGLSNAEYGALRDDIDKPLLNRALRGEYPPGSTVKPAIALAGLATGVTTPQHTRSCPGYFMLPGSSHRFRDWRPAGTARSPWKRRSRSPATSISMSSPRCWASRSSPAFSVILAWDKSPALISAVNVAASFRARRGKRPASRVLATRCGFPAKR